MKLIRIFCACVLIAAVHACAPPDAVVTIHFGNFAGSAWRVPNPETLRLYDAIIEQFEESHPTVKVVYKSGILRDDYSEWFAGHVLNETEPDVFLVLPEDFQLLADIGILHPLDDFVTPQNGLDRALFFDSSLEAGAQNGHQYAMPFEHDPTILFMNTSLLEAEGIDLPKADWTWEDFFEVCRMVTRDTDGDGIVDQFGVKNFDWVTALYTNRAQLFEKSGRQGLLDTEPVYDAFEFLNKVNGLSHGAAIPEFDSGKVAFEVSNFSHYRAYGYYPYSILKANPFTWKATVLPRGPNGRNAADLKILFIGVADRSPKKEAALAFMRFILSEESVQSKILQMSKGVPARKDFLAKDSIRPILLKDSTLGGNEISTDTLLRSIDDAMVIPNFRRYPAALSFIGGEVMGLRGTGDQLRNFLSLLNIKTNEFLNR